MEREKSEERKKSSRASLVLAFGEPRAPATLNMVIHGS